MIGISKSIFMEECKILFEDDIIIEGMKSANEYKLKEKLQKTNKRVYHLHDKEDICMVRFEREVVDIDTGKHMGISYMYSFRCDSDLGIGKSAYIRIPYACLICLENLLNTKSMRDVCIGKQ